jgi:transcriptional regulator with XRE-family HTH domain
LKENLRNELDFQGIIVKELSKRTNIPISTLDCYLRTQATEPSAENAVKIAQALQVTVEYLVIGKNVNIKKAKNVPCPEVREIIKHLETLSPDQCKAILNMIKAFKG